MAKRKKSRRAKRRKVKGHYRTLPSGRRVKVKPYYRKKRKNIRKKRSYKAPSKAARSRAAKKGWRTRRRRGN